MTTNLVERFPNQSSDLTFEAIQLQLKTGKKIGLLKTQKNPICNVSFVSKVTPNKFYTCPNFLLLHPAHDFQSSTTSLTLKIIWFSKSIASQPRTVEGFVTMHQGSFATGPFFSSPCKQSSKVFRNSSSANGHGRDITADADCNITEYTEQSYAYARH